MALLGIIGTGLIPSLASHGRCPCRFSLAFVVA